MNSQRKGGGSDRYDRSTAVESRLQGALKPVATPPAFERELRNRLMIKSEDPVVIAGPDYFPVFFLGAAGVFSGLLLLLLGIRAVIGLLNSLGLLNQVKPKFDQPAAAPPAA